MGASSSSEIIEAVALDDMAKVKKLLDDDIDRTKREVDKTSNDPEAEQNPLTALQVACMKNNPEMIRFLLEKRWDPSETDFWGNNALHMVLEKHDGTKHSDADLLQLVKDICSAKGCKVTPTQLAGMRNSHGETPLTTAVQHVYEDIVTFFLDTCDPDTINGVDSEGDTLIHSLCYRSAKNPGSAKGVNILREILSSGKFNESNKNLKDAHGLYPLHIAASQEASSELIAELISNGFHARVNIGDSPDNATPLIIAATRNNTAIAQVLLASSDKNFQTPKTKVSAISSALERGNLEMVKLLMANGCKPYVRLEYHQPHPSSRKQATNMPKEAEINALSVQQWVKKFFAAEYGTATRLEEVSKLLEGM